MSRLQKSETVSELKSSLAAAKAAFILNYRGLSVAQLQSLRRKVKEQEGSLRVAKARLMKIAATDANLSDEFKGKLKDQIGLVFALNETAPVAKVLVDFAKKNEFLEVVAGVFESRFVSKQQVELLASIPSKEVLIAQLAGLLKSPIASLVGLLKQPTFQLLFSLKGVADKKQ